MLVDGDDNPDLDEQWVLKLAVCGFYGCGKTSLGRRFADQDFSDTHKATIGVSFHIRCLCATQSDRTFKLHIWDTAGQERFATVMPQWFRGAHAYLFVYSVASRESFDRLPFWLEQARWVKGGSSWARDDNAAALGYLVAAQADRVRDREVGKEEAAEWAASHNLIYAETSARTGEGVQELFQSIVDACDASCTQLGPQSFRGNGELTLSATNAIVFVPQSRKKKCC